MRHRHNVISLQGERSAAAEAVIADAPRGSVYVAHVVGSRRRARSTSGARASAVRFIRMFFLSLLGLAASLVGVNALVDPYDLFGTRIPGVNAVKGEAYNHMRLYKAVAVERTRPAAIILGSSRAHFGLDPEHAGWSEPHAYNLSLFDGRIYEMLRYLQHAHAIQPLRQVVLALDLFSFNARQRTLGDFEEGRLAGGGEPWIVRRGPDLVAGLASLDALRSSLRTLRDQGDPCIPRATRGGMHDVAGFECAVRSGGLRKMFTDSEAVFLARYYNVYRFAYPDGAGTSLDVLREIVAFARDADIDLRLLISPAHARQNEAIDVAGLWSVWEQWKREMVAILAADAAAHPGARPFPLWDFSGYNSVTTEAVPAPDDVESTMRWYWDSSHYRKEAGDLVLDRVFGIHHPGRVPPHDFGVLLTTDDLEEHLRAIREAQVVYRRSRPGELPEIAGLAAAGVL